MKFDILRYNQRHFHLLISFPITSGSAEFYRVPSKIKYEVHVESGDLIAKLKSEPCKTIWALFKGKKG